MSFIYLITSMGGAPSKCSPATHLKINKTDLEATKTEIFQEQTSFSSREIENKLFPVNNN